MKVVEIGTVGRLGSLWSREKKVMAREIEIGTVVRLRSGGPTMTVVGKDTAMSDMINVAWFEAGKIDGGRFPPMALDVVDVDKERESARRKG